MQYTHIISAFLRGLSFTKNSGKHVTTYTMEQFKQSHYAKQVLPHKISLHHDIVIDTDYQSIDRANITQILDTIRRWYTSTQTQHNSMTALNIKNTVYVIHQYPTIQYTYDDVIQDKIVFITGAAQGLGKSIAEALVQKGAFVYIADINIQQAENTASEICEKHSTNTVRALNINCADELSVQTCANIVGQEVGGIDVLICNAGIVISGDIDTLTTSDFLKVTQVNYYGYFLLVKYFSPYMKYQHIANTSYYTDIIQINSKSGLNGSFKNSAYSGSKFGGIGLTKSFALELVEHNIKVNAVCPGNLYENSLWSDPEKGLFAQYLAAGKIPHARTIDDVRAAYEAKTPMKGGCNTDDVIKGVIYLIDQKFETGQALPISGGEIMLH